MTTEDWERLGDLLIARRVELGFPRRLPWARDVLGLSNDRIQSDLERARRTNFDAATLAQVEQQYRWAPGSIRAVLEGGEPTPLPATSPSRTDLSELLQTRPSLTLTVDQLRWRLEELTRAYLLAEDAVDKALAEQQRIGIQLRRIRQQISDRAEGAPVYDLSSAARDLGTGQPSPGQQRRLDADRAGDPPPDDPDDMEPR